MTAEYTAGTSRFTGKIHWVQLDVGTDDHDHFIDPEERLRIAMAKAPEFGMGFVPPPAGPES